MQTKMLELSHDTKNVNLQETERFWKWQNYKVAEKCYSQQKKAGLALKWAQQQEIEEKM